VDKNGQARPGSERSAAKGRRRAPAVATAPALRGSDAAGLPDHRSPGPDQISPPARVDGPQQPSPPGARNGAASRTRQPGCRTPTSRGTFLARKSNGNEPQELGAALALSGFGPLASEAPLAILVRQIGLHVGGPLQGIRMPARKPGREAADTTAVSFGGGGGPHAAPARFQAPVSRPWRHLLAAEVTGFRPASARGRPRDFFHDVKVCRPGVP